MSSKIKNDLFKSTKIFDGWGNKSIISFDWEVLNTLTEDELRSAFIPTENYTEGLKALKTTGNGNCFSNSASVLI